MTAAEIIQEMTLLPPEERVVVTDFVEKLPKEPISQKSPEELKEMADRMVESDDPVEQAAIKAAIIKGFYGD